MIGKIVRWVLVVLMCSILLVGVYWWRILTTGADGFRTRIDLQNELTTSDLDTLGVTLSGAFDIACRNRNTDETCIRWRVGLLGSESVYVEFRVISDKNPVILIRSSPYYLLSIGPSRIRQVHVRVEDLVVLALGENAKSVDRVRTPE